jgi:tetratricopeptide (TPR) repeat protein
MYTETLTIFSGRGQTEMIEETAQTHHVYDPITLLKNGDTYLEGCQYSEAIECFDRILKADPRDVDALIGKGKCLRRLGHCEQAIRCFDRILIQDMYHYEAVFERGICLLLLDRLEEAFENFCQAVHLNLRYENAWDYGAVCSLLLGDSALAEHYAMVDMHLRGEHWKYRPVQKKI